MKLFYTTHHYKSKFLTPHQKNGLYSSWQIEKMEHNFDIVIGPIADDGVAFQLELYTRQIITLETLVKELTYKKLNKQYFFGTELAISKLQKL